MSTRPYTDAHAIARLDFALLFKKDLDAETQQDLVSRLSSHLGKFGLQQLAPNDSDAVLDEDGDEVFAFARKDEDGDVVEEVHVHENYVHVVWSDYRGWLFSRDGAIERLGPAIDLISSGTVEFVGVGLAYRDVFLTDEGALFDASKVFRKDSELLPSFLIGKGSKWRHWSGWFEPESAVSQWRNACMLGIDLGERSQDDGPKVHVTEIVHRQRVYAAKEGSGAAAVELAMMWDEAHKQNRSLMNRLICDQMLELIGLKEGPNEHAMR